MLALETTASIADHRLVIQDHAARARVIILWESAKPAGRRSPPPELAGMGEEKGDILNGPPESDWEAHPRHPRPLLVGQSHTGQAWTTADRRHRNG